MKTVERFWEKTEEGPKKKGNKKIDTKSISDP